MGELRKHENWIIVVFFFSIIVGWQTSNEIQNSIDFRLLLSTQFFRYNNELPFNEGTFPFSMQSTQGIILQFNLYSADQLLSLCVASWLCFARPGPDMKTVGSLRPSGKRVDEVQSLNPPLLRLLDEKLGLVPKWKTFNPNNQLLNLISCFLSSFHKYPKLGLNHSIAFSLQLCFQLLTIIVLNLLHKADLVSQRA